MIRVAIALLAFAFSGGAMAGTDAAPKSRSGETIILGKHDVIRIEEPSSLHGRLTLSGHSRRFRRATDEAVYFAEDSDALTRTAKVALLEQAAWVTAHPQVRILVTGYSDSESDPKSSKTLGANRARAVARFLVEAGVNREQLLAIQSARLSKPTDRSAAEIAAKRRAVTRIVEVSRPEREDNDPSQVARRDSRDNPGGVGSGGTKDKD